MAVRGSASLSPSVCAGGNYRVGESSSVAAAAGTSGASRKSPRAAPCARTAPCGDGRGADHRMARARASPGPGGDLGGPRVGDSGGAGGVGKFAVAHGDALRARRRRGLGQRRVPQQDQPAGHAQTHGRGRTPSVYTLVVTGGPRLGEVESGAVAGAAGADLGSVGRRAVRDRGRGACRRLPRAQALRDADDWIAESATPSTRPLPRPSERTGIGTATLRLPLEAPRPDRSHDQTPRFAHRLFGSALAPSTLRAPHADERIEPAAFPARSKTLTQGNDYTMSVTTTQAASNYKPLPPRFPLASTHSLAKSLLNTLTCTESRSTSLPIPSTKTTTLHAL